MCAVGVLWATALRAQPPVAKPQPPPPVTSTTATATPAASSVPAPTPTSAKPAAAPAAPAAVPPSPSGSAAAPKGQPLAGVEAAPTVAQLGAPIYEGATFLGSYDAGRGQRYYLFGASLGFNEIVSYYRNVLKDKGELVFDQPPTHMFDTGKFKEETMAFPPSVTIKDYAWGGSPGYANPQPGAVPSAFATVIQIVPSPMPEPPRK